MRRFDLSARLVAIVVAGVLVTGLVITGVTALLMQRYLVTRLDASLVAASGADLEREHRGPGGHMRDMFGVGVGPGTIQVTIAANGDMTGTIVDLRDRDDDPVRDVTADVLARVAEVPSDGEIHRLRIPRLGSYRAVSVSSPDGTRMITAMPLRDQAETVSKIVRVGLLMVLFTGAGAGALGVLLVRSQLRPLREVAGVAGQVSQLDLASGTGEPTARVPEAYTDADTQVGAVGSALNALLVSMEAAFGARHRSEQQVRQFVADASHELRTPVTAIKGYADLASRSDDLTFLHDAAAKIGLQADRLSGLVDDLLLLARIDAGRPLAMEPVDVALLAAEEVHDASTLDAERAYELVVPDGGAEVRGDAMRLRQVITNLLTNAQRYTPAGTHVRVAVSSSEEAVTLAVSDDGPGLAPEFIGVAFDRFTRGDDGRSREVGGSGLGLAIVRAIAHAHGGSVAVESQPGATTFTVVLPSS